ncbi:MAG TPA: FKBP-type peptidyl-prolyl cis-trans isomerase [Verrucomicrobiae bacterium]|nr:FKBP-type peptidyl-prolyl cis-trans isomerase [Verrucomicrobiae bacterium]
MSTSRAQRIGIWTIAIVMAVGTIGGYFLIIVENENRNRIAQQAQEEQQKAQERASKPAEALPGYKAEKFDAKKVKELKTEDLKKGNGKEVKEGAQIEVNYFGWTPDGKIFDSTNRGGEVEPIGLSLGGVIEGWSKGLVGAKEGSTRKLIIPAKQAYGEQGSGSSIPPNTPLTFIVEITKVTS